MGRLERDFQPRLKKEIQRRLPGCVISKLDTGDTQGMPDLLILWHDRWAILEVKRASNSSRQPNQEYYVRMFNDMSFSAFICPENQEDVLNAMEQALRS